MEEKIKLICAKAAVAAALVAVAAALVAVDNSIIGINFYYTHSSPKDVISQEECGKLKQHSSTQMGNVESGNAVVRTEIQAVGNKQNLTYIQSHGLSYLHAREQMKELGEPMGLDEVLNG